MLGMFLNSRDADRVSHDLNVQTMQNYADAAHSIRNRIQMRQQAHQQWENKLDAAYRRMAKMQEYMEVQAAELNATNDVIRDLVDTSNPKNVQTIRKMRSRHIDNELDALLQKGVISNDPRMNRDWVEERGYDPR